MLHFARCYFVKFHLARFHFVKLHLEKLHSVKLHLGKFYFIKFQTSILRAFLNYLSTPHELRPFELNFATYYSCIS